MSFLENIIIGIGLSMDAFMIAFSKGVIWTKNEVLILSLSFGLFQMIMTILGFYFGNYFIPSDLPCKNILMSIVLFYIGIKMMDDTIKEEKKYSIGKVLLLSIISSVDALSIGISISLYTKYIIKIASIIGLVTLIISIIGCIIGCYIKDKNMKQTNKIGGIIIIIYAIKILLTR